MSAAIATAVLGAGLSALAVPAVADPPTCQGRTVTTTGWTGTEGDDVLLVVPEQYATVKTFGGDDLVCIAATPLAEWRAMTLDAGPGDDTVVNDSTDVESANYIIVLGEGSDSYRGLVPTSGANLFEEVHAGTTGSQDFGTYGVADTGVDTIETGSGDDTVFSGSAVPGVPNADVVRTGAGADTVRWAGEQTGPTLDLGPDMNTLSLHSGVQATAVVVDSSRQLATGDGRPVLRWAGAVSTVILQLDNKDVTFVGSDAGETLRMTALAGAAVPVGGSRSALMGRGDDALYLMAPGSGVVDGGTGRDSFHVSTCDKARLRLGGTSTCTTASAVSHTFDFARWENLFVEGADVSVRGSDRAETMKVVGTRVRIQGRGGADQLDPSVRGAWREQPEPVAVSGGRGNDRIVGSYAGDQLRGGPGDDVLSGQRGNDTLLGGTGRDKANGTGGRDRCDAEVTVACESR